MSHLLEYFEPQSDDEPEWLADASGGSESGSDCESDEESKGLLAAHEPGAFAFDVADAVASLAALRTAPTTRRRELAQ